MRWKGQIALPEPPRQAPRPAHDPLPTPVRSASSNGCRAADDIQAVDVESYKVVVAGKKRNAVQHGRSCNPCVSGFEPSTAAPCMRHHPGPRLSELRRVREHHELFHEPGEAFPLIDAPISFLSPTPKLRHRLERDGKCLSNHVMRESGPKSRKAPPRMDQAGYRGIEQDAVHAGYGFARTALRLAVRCSWMKASSSSGLSSAGHSAAR